MGVWKEKERKALWGRPKTAKDWIVKRAISLE